MKHAREDYSRIQDPSMIIPEDEPVFLIRAQDKIGYLAVKIWADLAALVGAKQEIVDKARVQSLLMQQWKKKKVPDIPDVAKGELCHHTKGEKRIDEAEFDPLDVDEEPKR